MPCVCVPVLVGGAFKGRGVLFEGQISESPCCCGATPAAVFWITAQPTGERNSGTRPVVVVRTIARREEREGGGQGARAEEERERGTGHKRAAGGRSRGAKRRKRRRQAGGAAAHRMCSGKLLHEPLDMPERVRAAASKRAQVF